MLINVPVSCPSRRYIIKDSYKVCDGDNSRQKYNNISSSPINEYVKKDRSCCFKVWSVVENSRRLCITYNSSYLEVIVVSSFPLTFVTHVGIKLFDGEVALLRIKSSARNRKVIEVGEDCPQNKRVLCCRHKHKFKIVSLLGDFADSLKLLYLR
eukprot:XP_001708096.1 Hypothetical protein GL50803_92738 [Giardia lamblia ATCC 50803]